MDSPNQKHQVLSRFTEETIQSRQNCSWGFGYVFIGGCQNIGPSLKYLYYFGALYFSAPVKLSTLLAAIVTLRVQLDTLCLALPLPHNNPMLWAPDVLPLLQSQSFTKFIHYATTLGFSYNWIMFMACNWAESFSPNHTDISALWRYTVQKL